MHGILEHVGGEEHAGQQNTSGFDIGRHLGLGLTIGYVVMSFVGVSYETWLLHWLRTSYLSYAEPEDFLMAGIRHPLVPVFALASAGVLALVLLASRGAKKRWAWHAQLAKRHETETWKHEPTRALSAVHRDLLRALHRAVFDSRKPADSGPRAPGADRDRTAPAGAAASPRA
jgi:hypothetical protein